MPLDVKVREAFREKFACTCGAGTGAKEPDVVVRSPGRVNLIGEHTDYNDGFVLPVAIDRAIWVAAASRPDRRVVIHALDFGEMAGFGLDEVEKGPPGHWSNYARGVAALLQERGYPIGGMDAVLSGNVPIGAGLSSSAALETALAYTWQVLGGFPLERVEMALLCQEAEHRYAGSRCGIMDQYIAALGRRGHALLIDCRSLEYKLVPLPLEEHGVAIVVCDSGVAHELAASGYNERRATCEEAVRLIGARLPGVRALRDVSMEQLQALQDELPEVVFKRSRHVISENARTLESVAALQRGDLASFGQLMNASHVSQRDDYEVSCPEIDALVELAWQVAGCYGSRLTGGGFGGCTVSLVDSQALDTFRDQVAQAYQVAFGRTPKIYTCSVEEGASVVKK
jgi:galactokinase